MAQKYNKRVFNNKIKISSDLSYTELRGLLKDEQRHDVRQAIKDLISNKLFAKGVFVLCFGFNIFFITLGVLNYLKIIG